MTDTLRDAIAAMQADDAPTERECGFQSVADALLAAGWTRVGDAAGLREDDPKVQRLIKAAKKFADWTIGGKIVEDPENREKYPLLVAEVLELREALAALARPSQAGDRQRVQVMRDANWRPAVDYWRERAEKAEAALAAMDAPKGDTP